jgi:hypothetical protein
MCIVLPVVVPWHPKSTVFWVALGISIPIRLYQHQKRHLFPSLVHKGRHHFPKSRVFQENVHRVTCCSLLASKKYCFLDGIGYYGSIPIRLQEHRKSQLFPSLVHKGRHYLPKSCFFKGNVQRVTCRRALASKKYGFLGGFEYFHTY